MAKRTTGKLTGQDALKLAVKDKEFAAQLVNNPGKFKAAFNLTPDEIAALKNVGKVRPGLGGAAEYE